MLSPFPALILFHLNSICFSSVVPKIFHISYTRAASPDSIYHLPLLPLPSVLFRNLRCEEEPGSQRCTSAVAASSQRFRQSALLSSVADVTLHHTGTGRRPKHHRTFPPDAWYLFAQVWESAAFRSTLLTGILYFAYLYHNYCLHKIILWNFLLTSSLKGLTSSGRSSSGRGGG